MRYKTIIDISTRTVFTSQSSQRVGYPADTLTGLSECVEQQVVLVVDAVPVEHEGQLALEDAALRVLEGDAEQKHGAAVVPVEVDTCQAGRQAGRQAGS